LSEFPQGAPADDPQARSLTAELTTDHREIDGLFLEARTALEDGRPEEAHRALDRIWMRLAVHIRAEHKVVFPALAKDRPDLQATLQALHEDHDFFMATLAAAVQGLRGPSPDPASARAAMEAVQQRLAAHNALEEDQVYPEADRLPGAEGARITRDAARELAFLPRRHGP
jgi:iron-sulfur cluster repair protein YtfE (RIC family)